MSTTYGGATDGADLSRAESTKKDEAWEENTVSLCTQSLPAAPQPPAPEPPAAGVRARTRCVRGSTLCT